MQLLAVAHPVSFVPSPFEWHLEKRHFLLGAADFVLEAMLDFLATLSDVAGCVPRCALNSFDFVVSSCLTALSCRLVLAIPMRLRRPRRAEDPPEPLHLKNGLLLLSLH